MPLVEPRSGAHLRDSAPAGLGWARNLLPSKFQEMLMLLVLELPFEWK